MRSTPHREPHHTTACRRVVATAAIYFRKFYLRGNDFGSHDPRGIALAALFLAAKTQVRCSHACHDT